ncbi:hypothetical protein NQ318_007585 [Aromia moschata]|uniref:Uncharacterized protein n=1 Tax=Aromia moschata TaxID=1265417 RepID=A0AAV8YCM9_9CUCU|nr:hypothetical protein NQ318_007585 [Aromia moschata]
MRAQREMTTKIMEIRDSYFVTYGIFYSMGVLTFVPYQFFATSTDYWMFKFRDPLQRHQPPSPNPDPDPGPDNEPDYPYPDPYPDPISYPDPDPGPTQRPGRDLFPMYQMLREEGLAHDRTPLQANFTSSFFIICQISMLGFLIVTAIFSKRLPPPQKRIIGALYSTLVLFLINAAFIWMNTDSFQVQFFGITMVLAVLLNVSSAVTMVSLFELVTKFPLDYYAAILSGQALCGIISSSLQILTLTINSNPMFTASIYFGVGSLLIFFTSIFYLVTKKKSKYFIYRIGQYEGNEVASNKWSINISKMKSALQRTKWFMGSLVFIQGSTAMIHPGLAALVVSEGKDQGGGEWSVKQPRNAIAILILAILRLGLVPLLMLCNAQPRTHMSVYFGDNVYTIIIILFGCSQGFLVNLCIVSVPMVARKEELEFVTVLIPLFSMITVTVCSTFNLAIISLI